MRTEQAHATANGVAKKEQANGHAKGHELSAEESEAMKDSFESHEPVGPPVYGEKKLDCSDAEWRARVDLAAAYRLCCVEGLNEGIVNHLTASIPGEHHNFLVFRFGRSWEEVTASNLLKMDLDGNVLTGDGKCDSSAFFIHSRIHEYRPAPTGAVFHTHQTAAAALSALEIDDLPMLHINNLFLYDNVVIDKTFNGRVDGDEEGRRLAAAMGKKNVLLQANHGPIVAAVDVATAWWYLYYLERAAKLTLAAMSTGRPLRTISDKVGAEGRENFDKLIPKMFAPLTFEAAKRRLLAGPHADFLS